MKGGGHYLGIGDRVRFYLLNEYNFQIDSEFKRKILIPNTKQILNKGIKNEELVMKITDFRPDRYNDLEIEGKTKDDFLIRLKLSQCAGLEIIIR